MTTKQQDSWKHGVAGCVAGLVSAVTLHPLDVIKTRLQVQDGIQRALPVYRGTRHALRSIVRQEGWTALYAGLAPALLGAGLSWGIYFAAYNNAKRRWQRRSRRAQLSAGQHLLAAAEGGCVVCCLTNPIWVVKTRLQLQRGGALAAATGVAQPLPGQGGGLYRGFVHAMRSIAAEEGVRGLYRGLGPSLLLVSHGAIQFMVYEELRKALVGRSAQKSGAGAVSLSSAQITFIGALSKLTASIATYPSSVVRARLQQRQHMGRALRYDDAWHTVKFTVAREGLGGLYKGLVPSVLRVVPASAITFLVYEKVMEALGRATSRWEQDEELVPS